MNSDDRRMRAATISVRLELLDRLGTHARAAATDLGGFNSRRLTESFVCRTEIFCVALHSVQSASILAARSDELPGRSFRF